MLSDPKSLNPALYPLFPTPLISMFVYSWSVRYDSRAHPIPDALKEVPTVANGDVSRNGMTLLYRIRPNIRWQDGVPLRCDDLKFTWQAVMNPHNNVATTDGYREIRSIDCSDPCVAVVHMKHPYAPFLQQLWGINGNTPILPAHLLARYNDARGSFNTAPYNALPVGSGPFRVVSWERGRAIRLVSNSRFYLGAPKLREVVFQIIPDMNTAEIELLEHQIDLIGGSQMYWPRFVALASDPRNGLTATRANQFVWGHIDFNLTGPITGDRTCAWRSHTQPIEARSWANSSIAYQSLRRRTRIPCSHGHTRASTFTGTSIRAGLGISLNEMDGTRAGRHPGEAGTAPGVYAQRLQRIQRRGRNRNPFAARWQDVGVAARS